MSRGEALAAGVGFLVLTLVGAALAYGGWRGLADYFGQQEWLETSCEIERSWVSGPFSASGGPGGELPAEAPTAWEGEAVTRSDDSDNRFRFQVRYRYEPSFSSQTVPPGGARSGTVYADDYDGSGAADAYRLRDLYDPGSFHSCWVDPADSDRAVLQRRGAGLPTVFLTIGGLFLSAAAWGVAWSFRRRRRRVLAGTVAPVSSAGKTPSGRLALSILFAAFLFFGVAFLIPMSENARRAVDVRSWETAECEVLSSEVASHRSDDGTTYSVEMIYAYRWDGRSYVGDRYDFVSGSSSGYRGKAEVVERHPPGSVVECRVNPREPWESVVDPSVFPGVLLGLLPLVFVAVGAIGLFFVLLAGPPAGASRGSRREVIRQRRRVAAALAPGQTGGATPEIGAFGGRVLEAQASPKAKFWLALAVALFWNGITWTVVWAASKDGGLDGCLMVFLGVFALVGVAFAVNVPYQFLALFNPRPRLEVDGPLHPGERPTVRWTFTGRPGRMQALRLVLTGHERATYRRGTDTHTASSQFAEIEILDTTLGPEIAQGSREIPIPADAVPSFKAPRNVVRWRLDLRGDVPRWPDVSASFPLAVEAPEPPPVEPGHEPRSMHLALREGFGGSEPGDALPTAEAEALACEPGEVIEVVARWDLGRTAAQDVLETLDLRLTWATSGRGDTDRETVLTRAVFADHPGPLPTTGEARVELTLPTQPYSFSGTLISLTWILELVAGFEEIGESATRVELVIGPGGREARLPEPKEI